MRIEISSFFYFNNLIVTAKVVVGEKRRKEKSRIRYEINSRGHLLPLLDHYQTWEPFAFNVVLVFLPSYLEFYPGDIGR